MKDVLRLAILVTVMVLLGIAAAEAPPMSTDDLIAWVAVSSAITSAGGQ